MIYVDTLTNYPNCKFKQKYWCHLTADSTIELIEFATQINLKPEWLQHAGKPSEHCDLTSNKRTQTVRANALEISKREWVTIYQKKVKKM